MGGSFSLKVNFSWGSLVRGALLDSTISTFFVNNVC